MSYWMIREFEDFYDKKGTPYRNKFQSQSDAQQFLKSLPLTSQRRCKIFKVSETKPRSPKELTPEQYGAWNIRIRKTPSDYQYFYEYKIELRGEDISKGWVSVPYGSNKDTTIVYAKQAIDTFYKNKVIISEHGDVLREKYDQFR